MDQRGISPVIATILLIAATAIAASAIVAYVGDLGVFTPVIRDVAVSGEVYDWQAGGAENYKNATLSLTVVVTSGTLRSIGDPAYGWSITLTCARTGWAGTYTAPAGGFVGAWGTVVTANTTDNGEQFTGFTNFAGTGTAASAEIRIPTDARGRVTRGSAITIRVEPYRAAHQENAAATVEWVNRDTINVIISGRDSQAKTGYDGAYLSGRAVT